MNKPSLVSEKISNDNHSVIFASAYRFTVLFSYTNLDPTYTLARTVGWTAIEMSAGIVSACLPTMRPALHLIIRNLGIKGSIPGLFRSTVSTVSPKTGQSNQSNVPAGIDSITGIVQVHARKGSQGAFYRLQDESRSGEPDGEMQVDTKLRPDHGYAYTVTSVPGTKGEGDSLSGDEIPLHSINVRKDLIQVTG